MGRSTWQLTLPSSASSNRATPPHIPRICRKLAATLADTLAVQWEPYELTASEWVQAYRQQSTKELSLERALTSGVVYLLEFHQKKRGFHKVVVL